MNLDITEAVASKFDRTNWNTIKFSDLVENIVEKVVPKESGLEHYIGLEHLDSGSLHIHRFGKTESLKGDKLKIYKGDFIFAKRNSYLKRVAIADFDAVASAHSLVLRAKPENALPEFLPFFLLSETFWKRAIEISVGSLSPTINWKVLAKQEFILPPKKQQAEIAELLWTINEVIQKEEEALESLKNFSLALIEDFIPRNFDKSWKLGDVIKARKGVTYKSTDYSDKENGIPLLNLKSIKRGGGFNKAGMKYFKGSHKESHLAKNTDLIIASTDITRAGNIVGYPLDPSVYQNQKMLFTMDLMAIEITSKELIRDYLYYALKSKLIHWKMFANSPGTTVLHLDLKGMLKIKIPKFPIENQEIRVKKLKEIDKNILLLQEKIDSSRSLMKSLINKIH